MNDLPLPPPDTPLLVWLANNPDVVAELIRFRNAVQRLEVSITIDGETQRGVLQTAGTSAVVAITL